jgi:hypothetical protein
MGGGISTNKEAQAQNESSCIIYEQDDDAIYLYTKFGVIRCINMTNEHSETGLEMSKNEMVRFIGNSLKSSSYRIWTNISSDHNKKNYNLVMSVNCKSNTDDREILNFMI